MAFKSRLKWIFKRPSSSSLLRIVVVDAQTFLIPAFSYDGQAPDAPFWVGKGNRPGPEGNFVADENGSDEPLRKYHKKTLVIVLPGDLTVFDLGEFPNK